MGYLDMNPPNKKEPTQHKMLIDVDVVVYSSTYSEYFINGKELSEYSELKDLKEQLLTLINLNK